MMTSTNQIYNNCSKNAVNVSQLARVASEIRGKKVYRKACYRWFDPEVRGRMRMEIAQAIEEAFKTLETQEAA